MRYKIQEARKAKGWSQQQLAEKIGTTQQTIQRYESGDRNIKADRLKQLSYALDVTVSYLLGLEDEGDGYAQVPVYGSIAAGRPLEFETSIGSFPVPEYLLAKYPQAYLMKVCGESMNKRIPDGCYALIDPEDRRPDEHGAFAVCVNGYTATIKRVKRLANGYELIPDSYDPTQRPIVFDYGEDGTDEVTIMGRVVWATMPFDYEI